jgi:hypothetical protein
MKVIRAGGQLAELALSRDELLLVNNALNEVCNGIDMFEFATRLGAGRDRVAALLAEVRSLIESMPPDGST